jgi:hypothetical protein
MSTNEEILSPSCADRPGILAAVSTGLEIATPISETTKSSFPIIHIKIDPKHQNGFDFRCVA